MSTIVLSKHDLNPDSTKVSRVVCTWLIHACIHENTIVRHTLQSLYAGAKTGIPVIASYNIPPGAVSDAVKNDIVAACVALVGTQSSA